VIASEVGSNKITPLFYSLYSKDAPDFTSENDKILEAIDQIGTAVQNRGIWVIDRGGDRDALYEPLLKNKRDFIISLVGSRNLITQGKPARSLWLAYGCRLPYQKSIVKIIHGKEVQFDLRFGCTPVQFPEMDAPLNLVVVKGFSSQPMLLLTTLKIKPGEKDLWFIIQAYMKR